MKISKVVVAAIVTVLIVIVGGGVYGVKAGADQNVKRLAVVQLQQKQDHDAAVAVAAKITAAATAAHVAAKAKADAAVKAKAAADLATAKQDAAEAKAQARANASKPPTVIYRRAAQTTTPYYPSYSGPGYGAFSLTSNAYPGPIHSYVSPSDASGFVATIPATSFVTVECSVHGETLQGHDLWDWDGSGWIWDRMVDMGGGSPPACGD